MLHAIALALVGAGLWAGYRWFRNESRHLRGDLKRAETALRNRQAHQAQTLEQDPETGVYRPRQQAE